MERSMVTWQRTKEQLIFLLFLVTHALVFIPNDGNILSDGTDEKKYLQRKYHEMQFYLLKYIDLNYFYNKIDFFIPLLTIKLIIFTCILRCGSFFILILPAQRLQISSE